ncbi:hydroxyethylthiazole kinase [Bacillus tianshenii]|nr:hydroxyethylthiazole kinase [Bacillus tianshenii]
MNSQAVLEAVENVRTNNPLIHSLTNVVVTNFTANGLLALGASPVMSTAKEEAADMASIANGVLINMGTLTPSEVEAMVLAGQAANKKGIPVVLDPVGVGATPFRSETVEKLLEHINFTVVRGNAGEIANVIGTKWEVRGVDSTGDGDVHSLAEEAAKKLNTTVIITGKVDVISDGVTTYEVHNGHEWLTKVTGGGCLLGAVISAFLATNEDTFKASVGALVYYGAAAQHAAEISSGPGTFQTAFLDALCNLSNDRLVELADFSCTSSKEANV